MNRSRLMICLDSPKDSLGIDLNCVSVYVRDYCLTKWFLREPHTYDFGDGRSITIKRFSDREVKE